MQSPSTQPMYDPEFVRPLREELVKVGCEELLAPEDVDAVLGEKEGTVLLVVNSICGCAAGSARPGVMLALQHDVIPDKLVTVFAGQDREATGKAREVLVDEDYLKESILEHGRLLSRRGREWRDDGSGQGFKNKLSPEQVQKLVDFLKTF